MRRRRDGGQRTPYPPAAAVLTSLPAITTADLRIVMWATACGRPVSYLTVDPGPLPAATE
ncbi:hypothetical protein EGT50_08720 [Rhodococcus xishaensis]|uniref:Uncharacterized protein n=1 Tax=Rhodococcus xishaensis TaxID=2487364 RepID=A0A438AVX8_9NOCA|nr:hypothetical protein EGT50_08720 [Rhodococcus xishaensis]